MNEEVAKQIHNTITIAESARKGGELNAHESIIILSHNDDAPSEQSMAGSMVSITATLVQAAKHCESFKNALLVATAYLSDVRLEDKDDMIAIPVEPNTVKS